MPYLYQIPIYNGIKMSKIIKNIIVISTSFLLISTFFIFGLLWSFSTISFSALLFASFHPRTSFRFLTRFLSTFLHRFQNITILLHRFSFLRLLLFRRFPRARSLAKNFLYLTFLRSGLVLFVAAFLP